MIHPRRRLGANEPGTVFNFFSSSEEEHSLFSLFYSLQWAIKNSHHTSCMQCTVCSVELSGEDGNIDMIFIFSVVVESLLIACRLLYWQ